MDIQTNLLSGLLPVQDMGVMTQVMGQEDASGSFLQLLQVLMPNAQMQAPTQTGATQTSQVDAMMQLLQTLTPEELNDLLSVLMDANAEEDAVSQVLIELFGEEDAEAMHELLMMPEQEDATNNSEQTMATRELLVPMLLAALSQQSTVQDAPQAYADVLSAHMAVQIKQTDATATDTPQMPQTPQILEMYGASPLPTAQTQQAIPSMTADATAYTEQPFSDAFRVMQSVQMQGTEQRIKVQGNTGTTQTTTSAEVNEAPVFEGILGWQLSRADAFTPDTAQAVDPQSIMTQLEARISQQLNTVHTQGTDSSQFTMQLEPESLGKISVTLTQESGKLAVSIVAENLRTQELLATRTDVLAQSLRQGDLEVQQVEVVQSGQMMDAFSQQSSLFQRHNQSFTPHGSRQNVSYDTALSSEAEEAQSELSPALGMSLYA